MKIKIKDEELARDLEKINKEVSKWPKWKRSVDLRDLQKLNRGESL